MSTPTQDFILGLSNLRAYWPLDDADPTDELVGGLDLTLTGSPTTGVDMGFAAGDTGVTFTETTQWASRAHNSAFDPGLSDWSVAFWAVIPTSTAQFRYVIGHDGNGGTGNWDIRHISSLIQGRFGSVTLTNSSFTPDSSVKFVVVNYDRDGNATPYIDGSALTATDISSLSATSLAENGTLYLARRETDGYGTVSLAHVVLRSGLWTPQEMTGAMAARLEDVESGAEAGLTTITAAAPTAAPKVSAPAGVATITGTATDGSFSFNAAMAGLAEMQVWATEWDHSELDTAPGAIPLEMESLPATTAVANEPVPEVQVNAGLATMTLKVFTHTPPPEQDAPPLRIPVSAYVRFGEENRLIRFDGFMRFQDEET